MTAELKMKKNLLLLLIPLVLFSCKQNRRAMLTKTWHATNLESKEMDSILTQGQKFIDTVGKNTDSVTNVATYGTANMDSLKHELQLQLDSVKMMQAESVTSTVFQFRKDSVAVLAFQGRTDSMKWQIEVDTITLSPLNGIGTLEEVRMEIISLADTSMKLKFRENGASSIVTFHPEK
jgi:hypothetical protein